MSSLDLEKSTPMGGSIYKDTDNKNNVKVTPEWTDEQYGSYSDVRLDPKMAGEIDVDTGILKYVDEVENEQVVPPAISRRLLLKADLYVTSWLALINGVAFADKVLSSSGSVLNLLQDTHMEQGSRFAWSTTIFYLCYLVASPFMVVLVKLPTARSLGVGFAVWGIIVACTAACSSYGGFMTCRGLLGAFEACVVPIQVQYISRFYPRELQFSRTNVFFAFNGSWAMIAIAIAYGLRVRFENNDIALSPWRVSYIIFGVLTALIGVSTVFFLPETPADAWFYTEEEKKWQVVSIRHNQGGYGAHNTTHFKWSQIAESFCDPRLYLIFISCVFENIPNGIITTFMSLILEGLNYSPKMNLLMQLPQGACEFVGCLMVAIISGIWFVNHRVIYALSAAGLNVMALCLVAWGPTAASQLAGLYLFAFLGPVAYVGFISFVQSNSAGHTKKLTMNTAVLAGYCVGNLVGPQAMLSSEKPEYPTGKTLMAASAAILFVGIAAMYALNLWVNHRRNIKNEKLPPGVHNAEFADLTDFQNPEFRYAH